MLTSIFCGFVSQKLCKAINLVLQNITTLTPKKFNQLKFNMRNFHQNPSKMVNPENYYVRFFVSTA
jgi:hypothetical protein